jgi:hypothetical protein
LVTQDAEMSADASERRIVSRKELAKEKRHATYQSAKERRATDPRYLAMKEAARLQQRAAYQKVKDRRKAVAADEKAKRKAERNAQYTGRVEANRELVMCVAWEFKDSIAQND